MLSFVATAQQNESHKLGIDIPEVALLALQSENGSGLNFNSALPNAASQNINMSGEEQSGIWINYSSIVRAGQKRKVTATVVGDIPPGVVLKVKASEGRGEGNGKLGEPLSWVIIKNVPVDVISNIGSCYTGRGVENGHMLSYKIEMDDQTDRYTSLVQSETSLQILYTLTDDN